MVTCSYSREDSVSQQGMKRMIETFYLQTVSLPAGLYTIPLAAREGQVDLAGIIRKANTILWLIAKRAI